MQVIDVPREEVAGVAITLGFSPDGRHLAMRSERLLILDTLAVRWLPLLPAAHGTGGFGFVGGGRTIAHSFLSRLVATELHTREVKYRDLERVRLTYGLVAAPDGNTVYLLAHPHDEPGSEVWYFDATALERRGVFARQKDRPYYLIGSADGRRLATGDIASNLPVRIWDTADLSRPDAPGVSIALKNKIYGFALAHDGSRLATVSTRGVTLWDVATAGEVFSSGKHRCGVDRVAFSPTRPLLATADTSANVFFWDFAGRVLARYDWGLSNVGSLAFAPDGLRCAAANSEKVVIWDVDV